MAIAVKGSAAVYPDAEFRDQLDRLIASAQRAGVGSRQIAATLTERATAVRMIAATTMPADQSL
jgi:hypothetical protein